MKNFILKNWFKLILAICALIVASSVLINSFKKEDKKMKLEKETKEESNTASIPNYKNLIIGRWEINVHENGRIENGTTMFNDSFNYEMSNSGRWIKETAYKIDRNFLIFLNDRNEITSEFMISILNENRFKLRSNIHDDFYIDGRKINN